jgi:hypothetical protein
MLLKAVPVVAAAILSLLVVLPALGAYQYTIGGVLCGVTMQIIVARTAWLECAPIATIFATSLGLAVIVGVFWPAALIAGLIWISAGGSGPDKPAEA